MSQWTQADVDRINARRGAARAVSTPVPALKQPSKYKNVKTIVDGYKFDSKREAEHYIALSLRQKAGEIRNLELQVPIDLLAPNPTRDGYIVIAQWVADFIYTECSTGQKHYIDAKGVRNRLYLLKRKWVELQDGIVIEEV